jgi:hypothetical protein
VADGQAHAARALWNLLHEYWTFRQGRFASLAEAGEAIRQARKDIDWMRCLPAPHPHAGPKVGMDRRIAVPLALSTGEKLRHEPWLPQVAGSPVLVRVQELAVRMDRQRRCQCCP